MSALLKGIVLMGYIRVERKILEWEWYKDKNTKAIFIHCILKANWKDGNFKGQPVPRGSFVTSLQKLASECGLSVREVRTALTHLQSTREVTCKTNTKYTMITVVNYDQYQTDDTPSDTPNDIQKKPKKKSHNNNSKTEQNTQAEAEALFNKLWSMYPFIKSGKSSVSLTQKLKIYSKVGEAQFIRCLERFKQHKCYDDPQYVVRASTFFNTTYADYLDENYQETMAIIDATPFVVSNNQSSKRNRQ